MVRLRREIEGIRRNHAMPPPPYAGDDLASALILPAVPDWLATHSQGRTLLAGAVPRALAERLVRAGQWVTVADLDEDSLRRWHADLAPEVAAQLTLLARPYGEVSFGPASFDRIALLDALATYREPQWLLAKVVRELKPDAYFALREVLRGPLPPAWQRETPRKRGRRANLAKRVLDPLGRAALGPLAPWLLGASALEAIDRGAHLQSLRCALEAKEVQSLVAGILTEEELWLGTPARLHACSLLSDAKPTLRTAILELIKFIPEAGFDPSEPADAVRCVGLVARRALPGGVRFS